MQDKNLFRTNRFSTFPQIFLDWIIPNILKFLHKFVTLSNVYYALLSVRRSSKKSAYCSYHSHLPWQLKEKIQFKNTTKSSMKTMDISSLLNTDLGNLND